VKPLWIRNTSLKHVYLYYLHIPRTVVSYVSYHYEADPDTVYAKYTVYGICVCIVCRQGTGKVQEKTVKI
jgi:hypothetical protein